MLTADRVTDGVDAAVGSLELLVDLDAVIGMGNAGAVETELLQVGLASGRDEEMRSFDDDALAVLMEMHGDALHRRLDPFDPRVGIEHDLSILEALDEDLGRLGVLVGEHVLGVEDGDM